MLIVVLFMIVIKLINLYRLFCLHQIMFSALTLLVGQ